jgi:predicted amidohydrolase
MDLSLALIQFEVAPSEPETNLRRMEEFIAQAAGAGAQLAVFPEDAVTGPLDGQTAFLEHSAAYLAHFQGLAVEYGIDLVPGTWCVRDGDAIYNTAYYLQRSGAVAGFYSKLHLWETERATLTPGASVSVLPTPHGLVGITICWDLAFPEQFAEMSRLGVELVVSPTYWSLTRLAEQRKAVERAELDLIDGLCRARAFESDLVLAYCNAAGELEVGDERDAVMSGRSQVCHPHEGVLARARGNAEELLLVQVRHQRAAP